METKEKIREFILRNIPETELQDEEDLFQGGLIGSMFVMQLVQFVEREFDITIGGEDLNLDYFRTVNRISELVERNRVAT